MNTLLYDLFGEDKIELVLLVVFARIFVFICCLPVHECAHAWMASKLGDDTGRLSGRITLNPLKHLDLVGTLMLVFLGFGYAKPVPVNINNFPAKKRKWYFALTAAAGPISNMLLAFLFVLLELVCRLILAGGSNDLAMIAMLFFKLTAQINILLALFNLIPVPPLDGSRLVTAALPDRIYYKLMQYERYFMIALFVIIFILPRLGVRLHFLSDLSTYIYTWLRELVGMPFGLS